VNTYGETLSRVKNDQYLLLMKRSNPLFSIVLPTYNREIFISNTINSILNQTFADFEILIVDNQSTDRTKEIVLNYEDPRIIFIQNDKNYERCYSRNVGIARSSGKYILFLDSDDLVEENHLLNWKDSLEESSFREGFFICNKKILIENKLIVEKDYLNFNTKKELLISLFQKPILPGQVCISKKIVNEYQFNKDYLIFEDTALWLQISNDITPIFFNFNSFIYRLHESNSVNWKFTNYGIQKIKSLKAFSSQNPNIIRLLSKNVVSKEFTITFFNICKYHIYNKNIKKALYFCFLSLIYKFSYHQLKHRLLVFIKLILRINIVEYSNML
jgi:glycosyltransferase involved in cell wall biosynthesis